MSEEHPPKFSPTGAARPSFEHVILTRFNVRYVEDPNAPSIGVDPGWLEERFGLFEQYCLPSVLAQTEQNFTWILFFDRATPEPYAERARALASRRAGFHPIFCDALPLSAVHETVRRVSRNDPQWLLTSRFDNDDGLHKDFVATVQRAQRFDRPEVLNCPMGIILRDNRAYRRRDPSNAFISLSEPFSGMQTVFSILRHVYARESYPVRQVASAPMWLQVIHDSNISNRVRGRRVPLASVAPQFVALSNRSTGAARESGLRILAENLSLYIVRSSRDIAVIIVRRVAKLVGVDIRRKAVQPRKTSGAAR
jgi:hypothetical protein